MATYYVVDKDEDDLGPNEVSAENTIYVSDGDVFIIGSGIEDDVQFEAASGSPTFEIRINEDSDEDFKIEVKDDLTANIFIADNVDAPEMEIEASSADAINLTIGDNVEFGDIELSEGNDTVTVGNSVVIDDITADKGDDHFVFGDDVTIDDFSLDEGDDYVQFGTGADVDGDFEAGDGSDTIASDSGTLGGSEFETQGAAPVCYTPGILIDTPDGPRAVETLRAGDLVDTLDHGPREVLWACTRQSNGLSATHPGCPVAIAPNALAPGVPNAPMTVSPQHRILLGPNAGLSEIFLEPVFVPAKALIGLPGVTALLDTSDITWVHFVCEDHEVVTANNCASESLLLGSEALKSMTETDRTAIYGLFGPPDAATPALNGPPARPCLTVGEARRRLSRRRAHPGTRAA